MKNNQFSFVKRANNFLTKKKLIEGAIELGIPPSQIFERISEIAKHFNKRSQVVRAAKKAKLDYIKGIKPDTTKRDLQVFKDVIKEIKNTSIPEQPNKPTQLEFKF